MSASAGGAVQPALSERPVRQSPQPFEREGPVALHQRRGVQEPNSRWLTATKRRDLTVPGKGRSIERCPVRYRGIAADDGNVHPGERETDQKASNFALEISWFRTQPKKAAGEPRRLLVRQPLACVDQKRTDIPAVSTCAHTLLLWKSLTVLVRKLNPVCEFSPQAYSATSTTPGPRP